MTGVPPRGRGRVFVRDALLVLLLNSGVAALLVLLALALAPQADPALRQRIVLVQFVYSQAIGLAIFGLLELPRLTRWWQRRAPLPELLLATALAVPAGFALGSLVAGALLAQPLALPLGGDPAAALVALVTVLASLVAVLMLTQRDRLEAERLRAENADMRASGARLQLLQQQIEPHMLFNTLANIHALIDEDPASAQRLLEALSELLQAAMQAGDQPLVALRQEFDLVEQYLRLMALRMGPRLRYTLQLPPELAAVRVPPLVLQPLVENAVRHGLGARPAGGTLQVTARRDGADVLVEVIDDGAGLQGADPWAGGRIGLANVRRRLGLAFGDEGRRLLLTENAPHGVRAALRLPALETRP